VSASLNVFAHTLSYPEALRWPQRYAVQELLDTTIIFSLNGKSSLQHPIHVALTQRFNPQVLRLARVALILVRVAREGIMSTTFKTLVVELGSGRPFVPDMSDVFADTMHTPLRSTPTGCT
jgi:hypothetical protein